MALFPATEFSLKETKTIMAQRDVKYNSMLGYP